MMRGGLLAGVFSVLILHPPCRHVNCFWKLEQFSFWLRARGGQRLSVSRTHYLAISEAFFNLHMVEKLFLPKYFGFHPDLLGLFVFFFSSLLLCCTDN